jgi:cellulose biosynthesis protein BcsQ
VGKTTLTMNVGAALAAQGQRTLLVDTDPQCNLTSYLIEENVVNDLLDKSDSPDGRTIWSAVKPISEALGQVHIIDPIETPTENMFLIPGDIRLSEFEVDLNDFWSQSLQRKPRGFRGSVAISELLSTLSEEMDIDFILYDSGPNIGALNRAILLDCDFFIIPVACDLFSLRALSTLGRTLAGWIRSWDTIADLAPEGTELLPGMPKFLGYIPEGFRIYGNSIIAAQAGYLRKIDNSIRSDIVKILEAVDESLIAVRRKSYRLGELRHSGGLVPASQSSGLPLFEVQAGAPYQRQQARASLTKIANAIIELSSR